MGSNSNKSLTKEGRILKLVNKTMNSKDTNSFDYQTTTGAKIRGELGIEKGNKLIKTLKEI